MARTVTPQPRDLDMVPWWWKIVVAHPKDGTAFRTVRRGRLNPDVDALSIAQLLWRDEVLEELMALGLARGLKTQPRRVLWRKLADSLDLPQLRRLVRRRLKTRSDWRSAGTRKSCDGMSQPFAT
jgi:hypothetical protein